MGGTVGGRRLVSEGVLVVAMQSAVFLVLKRKQQGVGKFRNLEGITESPVTHGEIDIL